MSTGLSDEFTGINVTSGSGVSSYHIDSMDRNDQCKNDTTSKSQWQTTIKNYFTPIIDNKEINERREDRSEFDNFVYKFQSSIKGKKLIHDVVPDVSASRSQEFLSRCIQQKYKGGIFWWVFHTDHVHVVHDCSWSGGYCRCSRIQDLPIKRSNRKFIWSHDINYGYIGHLANYLLQPPRESMYCEISGRAWPISDKIRNVSSFANCNFGEEPMVEASCSTSQFLNTIACGSTTNPGRPSCSQSQSEHFENTKYQKRGKEEKLLSFFRQYPTSPVLNLLLTRIWSNSEFKFIRRNDPLLQVIIDNINCELLDSTVESIFEYVNTVTPLYHAPRGDVNEYYYNIDVSLVS